MRAFPPLPPNHPSVGTLCAVCGQPILAGAVTTLIARQPAGDEEAAKAAAGKPYTAEADLVHWHCRETPR